MALASPTSKFAGAKHKRAITRHMLHVLFAIDANGDNVRVVTPYRPDPLQ